MTHETSIKHERGHILAACTCGWERLASTETQAAEYGRQHKPKEREG